MENLTPPAAAKNAPDGAPPAQAVPRWNVASWNRCARISASTSSPAPERGADRHRPRYAPGCTRRSSTTTPAQTKGQSSSAHRAACPGLFLLPIFQPCRLPGLPDQQQTGPARCPRRPPDDHASAPPPQQITKPTCTTCQQQTSTSTSAAPMTPQPISCTACPLPTASSQQRQTSQQPAPAACTYQQHQRTPQPCRLPAAADQHHPRPPNGQKPAHRGPLPEGSDSLPDRHIDFAV